MRKAVKKFNFTLVELLVSMGVFTIMMLALMQFFNSAQKLWTSSEKRVGTFSDARVAMNLMSTMLQTAFFENDEGSPSAGLVPFSSQPVTGTPAYDRIAFATDTSYALDPASISRLYEVGFEVDPADDHTLKIYYVGDATPSTWNFYWNTTSTFIEDVFATSGTEIIPYVMELKFTCFDKDMNSLATSTAFPHAVMIRMSLLDKIAYQIWKTKTGINVNNPTGSTGAALEYLNENKRTFTTIIYIGDRGQG